MSLASPGIGVFAPFFGSVVVYREEGREEPRKSCSVLQLKPRVKKYLMKYIKSTLKRTHNLYFVLGKLTASYTPINGMLLLYYFERVINF